jgi:hypothetical protein
VPDRPVRGFPRGAWRCREAAWQFHPERLGDGSFEHMVEIGPAHDATSFLNGPAF